MLPLLLAGGTAIASGIGGGLSAGSEADRKRKYYDQFLSGIGELEGEIGQNAQNRITGVQEVYRPMLEGFEGNAQDYFDTLKNTDYSQFNIDPQGEFSFDMQQAIQENMNPAIQSIIDRSTGEVMQSAANRGGLFSGATAKGIARSTADIQAQEYDKARGAAQQDRQNKYQQFTDFFDNALRTAEFNRSNLNQTIQNKGNLFGAQSQVFGQQRGEVTGIQDAADTARFDLKGQGIEAKANRDSTSGYWEAFGSGALGGFSGGAGGAAQVYSSFK